MATAIDAKAAAQSAAMSDHLVRVGHLKALQRAKGWSKAELGRHCGRQPQQVEAWFTGKRQIGERLARALEERLGLPRYGLDDRGGVHRGAAGAAEATPTFGIHSGGAPAVTPHLRELPVISWGEIAAMLDTESARLRNRAPHLETYAPGSSRAKFVEMPDDSMAPLVNRGDHLLFDPAEAPRAGDIVLVRLPSHEHFVRTFRPRTAYVFDAVPHNADYQTLSSTDDATQVVAVMVEHRRYRRASSSGG